MVLGLSPLWDVLFWAGLLFLLNVPFVAFEPLLRVRGLFAIAALPQIVVNLATILLVGGLFMAEGFLTGGEPPRRSVLLCVVAAQFTAQAEIGRASCRGRVVQYV